MKDGEERVAMIPVNREHVSRKVEIVRSKQSLKGQVLNHSFN
jgi:hypothetical protein